MTLAAATLLATMGNTGSDQNCNQISWSISGSTDSATEITGIDHSQRFTDECATKLAQAMIFDDWSDPEGLCRTCFEGWTEDAARRNDCTSTWLPGDSVYNWFKTCKETSPVVSNCPLEWMDSGDCDSSYVGLECEYGQECCCGECNAKYISTCTESGWLGSYNYNLGHCDESQCEDDTVCPPDFPVCDDVGDCIKAHCANGGCSWDQGVNWTNGPSDDGVPCESSWEDYAEDVCPAHMYHATTGEACDDVGLECTYGEECCCGECHSIMRSLCTGDGWLAVYIDACDESTSCYYWPSYQRLTANLTWPWGNATLMGLNTVGHYGYETGMAWNTTNSTSHPTELAWSNGTELAWANETWQAWNATNATSPSGPAWANETSPAWANGTELVWANATNFNSTTTNDTQPTL